LSGVRAITDWHTYLTGFHARSPGVTEDVLTRADDGGQTPYDWLARAIPPDVSRVLDVGCGSGVMARVLAQAVPGRRTEVVGVDLSQAELARAAQHEASAGMLTRPACRVPIGASMPSSAR